jgi:3-oxoacyl-[acyl-carrier protein] reductase
MDYGIAARTALVVGGSKGIGFDVARMLAAEGSQVAIVARSQHHIDKAVAAITDADELAIGVSADMSTEDGITTAVDWVTDRIGAPSIILTQADFHVRSRFAEIERADDFVDSFRAYTLSQAFMLRAVLPAMASEGWGRYVHIGSATAKQPQSTPPHTVANATRPSTVGLLKSVADEYARYGITINTVAPGWIATKTTVWYLSTHEGLNDDDARQSWMIETAGVPAGRLLTQAGISAIARYSPNAKRSLGGLRENGLVAETAIRLTSTRRRAQFTRGREPPGALRLRRGRRRWRWRGQTRLGRWTCLAVLAKRR